MPKKIYLYPCNRMERDFGCKEPIEHRNFADVMIAQANYGKHGYSPTVRVR
jgi:hypothetical protein